MVLTKLASLLALASTVAGQTGMATNKGTYLQNVAIDGPNPTKVGCNLYVPPTVIKNAPIVVVPHYCHGSADAMFNWSFFPGYADKYGFIVIFPDSPNTADKCWDLSSKQTLTHNGGGDAQGIVSMVQYVAKKYESDLARVFVTGVSSGGMMTQNLLGSYPDVFAAGVSFAGVPFGCYADPAGGFGTWSAACATGTVTHTGAEWAQIVKNAYPGYTGYRPKLQIYHGTVDQTVSYVNFGESIKEWTSVFGISATPVKTTADTPKAGWTKTVYGNGELEAFSAAGVTHDIEFRQDDIAAYFQLTCPAGNSTCLRRPDVPTTAPTTTVPVTTAAPTTTVPATTKTTTAPATTAAPTTTVPATTKTTTAPVTTVPVTTKTTTAPTTTAPAGTVPKWGQCGGIGYTGPTTCKDSTCVKSNDWYSQCL